MKQAHNVPVRLLPALLLAVLVFAGACATTGGTTGSNPNLLTREQLEASDAGNLYELIERERPRWLTGRGAVSVNMPGAAILVYQDQTRLGGLDILRQLRPGSFTSIRFLDGPTASSTLPGTGGVHLAGAIVLSTR